MLCIVVLAFVDVDASACKIKLYTHFSVFFFFFDNISLQMQNISVCVCCFGLSGDERCQKHESIRRTRLMLVMGQKKRSRKVEKSWDAQHWASTGEEKVQQKKNDVNWNEEWKRLECVAPNDDVINPYCVTVVHREWGMLLAFRWFATIPAEHRGRYSSNVLPFRRW